MYVQIMLECYFSKQPNCLPLVLQGRFQNKTLPWASKFLYFYTNMEHLQLALSLLHCSGYKITEFSKRDLLQQSDIQEQLHCTQQQQLQHVHGMLFESSNACVSDPQETERKYRVQFALAHAVTTVFNQSLKSYLYVTSEYEYIKNHKDSQNFEGFCSSFVTLTLS